MIEVLSQIPGPPLLSFGPLLALLVKAFLTCCAGHYFVSELSMHPAAVKNRVATATFVVLALLPILALFTPPLAISVLPNNRGGDATAATPWLNAALWFYVIVIVLLSLRLLIQVLRTGIISARSRPAPETWPLTEQKYLRLSDDIRSPLTWGSLKPFVLLPAQSIHWTQAERRMVLQHETAHIERGDWLTILLARWVCILYWPVPGIRRLLTALSVTIEQACDDRVIAGGASATAYAALLVKLARNDRIDASIALAQATGLSVRVRYLVAEIVDRSTLDPQRRWVYPICILIALPLSAVTLVEEPIRTKLLPLQRPKPPELLPVEVSVKPVHTLTLAPRRPMEVAKPPDMRAIEQSHTWRGKDATVPPP